MNAKDLESALADLDKTIKKNPQGLAHDAAVKARARVVVLLEEKKLVEGAQAAQEAKEEAEVTVRTKYDHEANKLLKRFKALAVRNPYQAMAVYDRLRATPAPPLWRTPIRMPPESPASLTASWRS